MEKQKLFWTILLFIDILLFLQAILSHNLYITLLVAVIAGIIYFKGYSALFSDFDEQQRLRREKRKEEFLKARALGRKYSK